MIRVSETVVLKSLSLTDTTDIFTKIDSERVYFREWLPFIDRTQHESDTIGFVRGILEQEQKVYTIQENSIFVGLIGFNNMDNANSKAQIGYWLSEKSQGKGIITQSVQRLLNYAFDDLYLNRITIRSAVNNIKSRRIPERLGFMLEGIERDGELLVDNKFTDIAVYSILSNELNNICR